ncbi:MAG: LytR family transcriptional regulator [Ruminococcaceae bacterium]|nr:LytR family transcriptional regulator [Oscillospiraceae bacterium]
MSNRVSKDNQNDDVSMYYPDGDYENIAADDEYLSTLKRKQKLRKKRGKLSRSQKGMIVGIFILYALILFAIAWITFYKPAQPGGEEIPFETGPVQSENGNINIDIDHPNNEYTPETPDKVGDFTVVDGIYNILLVGHDRAATLADVTMLINCNTNDKTITVMQLPRDTCVQDFITNKLNAVYSTYYNGAISKGKEEAYNTAMEELSGILEKTLCINIHHTAVLNLDGLINIVNILGGVELYVPKDMQYYDPEQGLDINLKEGYQTLTGEQAEEFVRFRSGFLQQDLGRINAQKIFMTALFQKVKSSISITNSDKIAQVAGEVFKNLHTDMSLADVLFYAKFLLGVNLDELNMTTIPGNLTASYYVINRAATLDIINEYFNIYNTEITDDIFDRNHFFCLDDPALEKYYFADAETVLDEMHNGQDISDDSIYIP